MGWPHTLFGTMRDHYLLLFGTAGSFALLTGLVGAWLGARFGTRSALRRHASQPLDGVATQADLRVLSDEVQTVLIELERIAEGQRFVTKLMAERNDRAALPSPAPRQLREPGTITPH
ncbi:MAG TPA: hypothetical protein VGM50_04530 [Gemmatimonadaceae bacterium]